MPLSNSEYNKKIERAERLGRALRDSAQRTHDDASAVVARAADDLVDALVSRFSPLPQKAPRTAIAWRLVRGGLGVGVGDLLDPFARDPRAVRDARSRLVRLSEEIAGLDEPEARAMVDAECKSEQSASDLRVRLAIFNAVRVVDKFLVVPEANSRRVVQLGQAFVSGVQAIVFVTPDDFRVMAHPHTKYLQSIRARNVLLRARPPAEAEVGVDGSPQFERSIVELMGLREALVLANKTRDPTQGRVLAPLPMPLL